MKEQKKVQPALFAPLCVSFSLLVSACATQHVSLTMQAPAIVNLKAKGVQSLAVTTFEGPGESGRRMAELLTAKLVERDYFKVVERDKLLALEKEQVLGMTGVVDEKMAAKAGKVLGVGALMFGKIVPHPGQGKVTATYRIVRTETGEILAARQVMAGNAEAGHVMRRAIQREAEERSELLEKLEQHLAFKIAAGIQPHPVKVEREFENGGWLFGDADVKRGIEYIKADRPEDAIAQWEGVVQRDPGNSAAWYDLGIAYELLSQFGKAEQAYRTAEKLDPKPHYIQAVSHVKTAAESHRKLEEEK